MTRLRAARPRGLRRWQVWLTGLAVSGCLDGGGSPVGCYPQALYGASAQAPFLPLDAGQRAALVRVRMADVEGFFCTGVIVVEGWVLTAAHCVGAPESVVWLGEGEGETIPVVASGEVVVHPELDLALIPIGPPPAPVPMTAPVVPIPTPGTPMDASWVGTPVQLAGFGVTETGSAGGLRFLVESIVALDDTHVTVRGSDATGACQGDSGGPLLARGDDGRVQVVGILSLGSASCTGVDKYIRLDSPRAWIEAVAGASPLAQGGCGEITSRGQCRRDLALHCEDGILRATRCEAPERCVWSADAAGYRCASGAGPCDGVGDIGECVEGVARVCDDGVLRQTSCRADCDQGCRRSAVTGIATCGPVD